MKKVLVWIIALVMTIISVASLADGFLPALNELFDVEMPNMENALKREADSVQTLPDGSLQMVFHQIGRDEYNACSAYLGSAGCTVVSNTRERKSVAAVLEKEGKTFTFVYDMENETVTVTYPLKTVAEAFVNQKIKIQIGDIIPFGHYEQDNQTFNGREPVEWIVIDKIGGKLLLISRYVLDMKPYHDAGTNITWENCSLRKWLNGSFYSTAFDMEEQKAIKTADIKNGKDQSYLKKDGGNDTQDRVFLLSYAQALQYVEGTLLSTAAATKYAKGRGRCDGSWWLRSRGAMADQASYVSSNGEMKKCFTVNHEGTGVRPAIWIDPEEPGVKEIFAASMLPVNEPTAGNTQTGEITAGAIVIFGHYEQDNDKSNGQEPIEWVVLAKEGSKVLLISRYGLNAHCYHKETPYPTWAKSDIRNWLNSTFLNEAFTPAEQAGIVTTTVSTPSYYGNSGGADTQDKIWLLSREEAEKYYRHDASRKAVPTVYAVARGAWQYDGNNIASKLNGEGCCWWWLRSPGYISNSASSVYGDGSLNFINVYYAINAVRPAFWLNLDSGIF